MSVSFLVVVNRSMCFDMSAGARALRELSGRIFQKIPVWLVPTQFMLSFSPICIVLGRVGTHSAVVAGTFVRTSPIVVFVGASTGVESTWSQSASKRRRQHLWLTR